MSIKNLIKIANYYNAKYKFAASEIDDEIDYINIPGAQQNHFVDAAKDILGISPIKPPTTNTMIDVQNHANILQAKNKLKHLKTMANVSNDLKLATDVHTFIYQISQNKLLLNQIQDRMVELYSNLPRSIY